MDLALFFSSLFFFSCLDFFLFSSSISILLFYRFYLFSFIFIQYWNSLGI